MGVISDFNNSSELRDWELQHSTIKKALINCFWRDSSNEISICHVLVNCLFYYLQNINLLGDKTLALERENRVQVQIRSATTEDSTPIALLCQELGYSTSEQDVQERLRRFEQNAERVMYVAYLPNELIIGWVHVYISESLLTGRRAEIDGLIVNELYRGCGAGRLLTQSAEEWAKEQGCDSVYVRSNIVRQDAHIFYQKIGYTSIKTQLVLQKFL